jgi:hypothetical protein
MLKKNAQYIVKKNKDDSPDILIRFCHDETGFWSEYLDDNQWIEESSLMDILRELHNPAYDEVTEEEAAKIAQSLGGSI